MLWSMKETFLISLSKLMFSTYDKIKKITDGYEDDFTTSCLDHPCFKKHNKMKVIDLSNITII